MHRIFTNLAILSLFLVAATLVVGFFVGDLYERPQPSLEVMHRFRVHFFLGLAAALSVVFVNSIVVTYFIGTGRWCKEVSETYNLEPELLQRSNRLKRKTFPWAVCAMLAIVGTIALGAAADPATGRTNTPAWVTPHFAAALTVLAFLTWAYFVEAQNLRAHHEVVSEILERVRQIRAERGLSVE